MNMKRFIIEMGTGVDQHGQDSTKAATRAVEDAVRRVCLAGLGEILKVSSPEDMMLDIFIACPNPQTVNTDAVLKALPFGKKQLRVVEGGMQLIASVSNPADKTADAVMANAAISVSVDMDKVLTAWGKA